MSLAWFVAAACVAVLPADPANANEGGGLGLTTSSFSSNELRTGFARLFRNGVEQPYSSFPYSLLTNTDFVGTTPDPPLQQQFRRPAPFGPQLSPTFHGRPRYEYPLYVSWVIPYYYVPTRFHPSRGGGGGGGGKGFGGGGGGGFGGFGGRRPNDVLVIVVKTNKNCTNEGNGTNSGDKPPADGGADDDDDDDDGGDEDDKEGGLNPDDEVESVNVVAGGAEGQKEPSRCVWAILACCAPANAPIRYTCFDVLGCSTAFWDTNPCVPEIVKAVLGQASTFLNGGGKGNDTTTTTPAPAPAPAEPPAEAASDNLAALATVLVATATATPVAASDVTSPPASAAAAT